MDSYKKIFKWIIIWTTILFIPVLIFGGFMATLTGAALGAITPFTTMFFVGVMFFFFTPQILVLWLAGIAIIFLEAWESHRSSQSRKSVSIHPFKRGVSKENYRCGTCCWFDESRCKRREALINAEPCKNFEPVAYVKIT